MIMMMIIMIIVIIIVIISIVLSRILRTHAVIEDGDDYFVQDYNDEDLYVDFFNIKMVCPRTQRLKWKGVACFDVGVVCFS